MSITAERLMVEVQADVRDALRKLDMVEKRSASTMSRVGKLARSMGLMFGGAAVVSGISKTINLAMNFDQTMRQVGVQTDLSGRKLERLSDLALKMGKDTIYSAQQASQSMLELSKGGLDAAVIRGGALEQTLRLAAAGGLELDAAAGYIVQGLNTYSLKAKQAVQVTTALAGGANASSVSVDDLGLSLSQVGPGAVNAGMSIQETVAALAAFGNAGIRGSDAGTTLKTMLASLVPNTVKAKDAMKEYGLEFVKRNGDFKSMTQVAQELKDGLGDLSQSERSAAMRTIFGSDATRAATVLMKEGAKGIRSYIKATKDQKKTQQMANTAMEGAKGAWENFKGSVETAAIVLGTRLLPGFTKAAKKGADFVDETLSWGPAIVENFGWTIDVAKGLVTAFTPLIELAKNAADAWGELPTPVKQVGVQLAVAIAIFPRLAGVAAATGARVSGAFTAMSTKAKQFTADMSVAETRTARLGSAARTAAGIGGMLALTKASEQTSKKMGALAGAAAGGLMGFSLAGPWGAAIGAGAGALWGLENATDHTAMTMDEAKGKAVDYASSLDQITGAATRATRATIAQDLQERGVLTNATKLGIQTRDLVSAIMGHDDAQKRVNKTLQAADHWLMQMGKEGKLTDGMFRKWGPRIGQVRGFLEAMTPELRKAIRETREAGQATQEWRQALKGVPAKVKTKLEQAGYEQSYEQLVKLKKRYDLTPKVMETIVKALNVDVTKRQMEELTGKAKKLGGVKPWFRVEAETTKANKNLDVVKKKAQEFGLLKPNPTVGVEDQASSRLVGILGLVSRLDGKHATVTITQSIRQVGKMIGGALPTFDTGGFTGGRSAKDVTGVVHGKEYVMDAETTKRALPLLKAIHAAKGRVFGYAAGGQAGDPPGAPKLTAKESAAKQAAQARRREATEFLRRFARTIAQADGHFGKTFTQLGKIIRQNMSGAKEASWLKKARQTQEKLVRIGERQEAVQKRLAKAQERVADMRQAKGSFVDTVRSGIAGQATVLNAGNTATAIRTSLGVQVAKVKKFAQMLRKLRKMGYSDGVVKQVAAAGVEGGYNAAAALVAADAQTMAGINTDFATIRRIGGDTARQLGAEMFDAGIEGARGLVRGLKDRRHEIQETMMDLAMAMQKALKKALGIHSKSRAMRSLGKESGAGLAAGLQDQEKAVSRASMGLGVAATHAARYGGRGPSVAALQGGLRAGASITFNFKTVNPQAEPQSRTTNKALAKVAALGLV